MFIDTAPIKKKWNFQ